MIFHFVRDQERSFYGVFITFLSLVFFSSCHPSPDEACKILPKARVALVEIRSEMISGYPEIDSGRWGNRRPASVFEVTPAQKRGWLGVTEDWLKVVQAFKDDVRNSSLVVKAEPKADTLRRLDQLNFDLVVFHGFVAIGKLRQAVETSEEIDSELSQFQGLLCGAP